MNIHFYQSFCHMCITKREKEEVRDSFLHSIMPKEKNSSTHCTFKKKSAVGKVEFYVKLPQHEFAEVVEFVATVESPGLIT